MQITPMPPTGKAAGEQREAQRQVVGCWLKHPRTCILLQGRPKAVESASEWWGSCAAVQRRGKWQPASPALSASGVVLLHQQDDRCVMTMHLMTAF